MYKIEKLPIIPRRTTESYGRPCRYPWPEMSVGDSIFVGYKDPGAIRKNGGTGSPRAAHAAYAYGQRHKKKFIYRTVDKGIRIWRIV